MEAPKLPTVFRQNRARSFDYKPRYYDQAKERKQEIRDLVQQGPSRAGKEEFRQKMRSMIRQGDRSGQTRSSNVRLFAIIILLFMIAYLIIQY